VQACGLVLMFSLHRTDVISRLWFGYWTAITGGSLLACRLLAYGVLRRVRYAGMNLRDVAVVGYGYHCQHVVRKMEASTASGFRASAVFDVRPVVGVVPAGVPVYVDLEKFSEYVRSNDVQEIWLALPLSEESTILRFVDEFRNDLVNIRFIPDVQSVALFDSSMIDLIGEPAINLVASPLSPHALVQKEIFDRIFAAVALIALAPLLTIVAIAVKLSSHGPVFFTQFRKGADGRVFKIYKFRTMRPHVEKAGVVTQATKRDPRITRVGGFLRRTSLDELPQFFNVLRGEMSVVGPRPHAIEHDELYQKVVKGYIHRYRIKPGITGWAQVNGFRGETDRVEKMQKRVEHDLYYLRNWSFTLDMRIVLATVAKGLVNSNAY
jgi:Undecaprenyl-phosphate glucose phosphotransferase